MTLGAIKTFRGLLVAACSIALMNPVSAASAVLPTNLYTLVKLSRFAFSGLVDSMLTEKVGNDVVTHVHFTDTRFAIGSAPRDGFILTIAGGRYKGLIYLNDDTPVFKRGGRYIILARDEGRRETEYMPILYGYQGFFEVQRPNGHQDSSIVVDAFERPIAGIVGRHLVLVEKRRFQGEIGAFPKVIRVHGGSMKPLDRAEPIFEIVPPELDPRTRITEAKLLRAVEAMARER